MEKRGQGAFEYMDFFSAEKNSTRKRGQGAFEYILMLGGILLVVLVVTLTLRGQLGGAGQTVNQSTGTANTLTCLPTDMGRETSGLVGSWHMNEGSGTAVADSSVQNLQGTLTTASWTDGKFGNAISLDGSSNRVSLGLAPALDLPSSFTVEAWIWRNSVDAVAADTIFGSWTWAVDLQSRRGTDLRFAINDGRPQFVVEGQDGAGTVTELQVFATAATPLNQWVHVAGVFDLQNDVSRIYVNGVLNNSQNIGAAIVSMKPNTGTAKYLGYGSTNGGWFSGRIDEVKVYSRALPQSEIQADMACSLPG